MGGRHLVLFGAGMTGRGQVAQLAAEDGWRLTLVDRDAALVNALRRAGAYTVRLLSAQGVREVPIAGYQALHTSEAGPVTEAVSAADLVVTSVLEPNLPEVASTLSWALEQRLRHGSGEPLNIIAAENMSNSSSILGQHVLAALPPDLHDLSRHLLGFPDSMIARVVPVAADPLVISGEAYSEWTADRGAAVGEPPALAGLEWVSNQTARLERKLFIHNTGHAVCGYHGWLAGYQFIHEAAGDPAIMGAIRAATAQSGAGVAAEHGFSAADIAAYCDNLAERLVIADLPDDIRRVIRQPIRKLGPRERLLGPLVLCERHGLPAEALCRAIAAVLASRMDGDDQFARLAEATARLGPVGALAELTGYEASAQDGELIAAAYQELAKG
jgi:mannitol-1-phosphate 5-dehydrogenase